MALDGRKESEGIRARYQQFVVRRTVQVAAFGITTRNAPVSLQFNPLGARLQMQDRYWRHFQPTRHGELHVNRFEAGTAKGVN